MFECEFQHEHLCGLTQDQNDSFCGDRCHTPSYDWELFFRQGSFSYIYLAGYDMPKDTYARSVLL